MVQLAPCCRIHPNFTFFMSGSTPFRGRKRRPVGRTTRSFGLIWVATRVSDPSTGHGRAVHRLPHAMRPCAPRAAARHPPNRPFCARRAVPPRRCTRLPALLAHPMRPRPRPACPRPRCEPISTHPMQLARARAPLAGSAPITPCSPLPSPSQSHSPTGPPAPNVFRAEHHRSAAHRAPPAPPTWPGRRPAPARAAHRDGLPGRRAPAPPTRACMCGSAARPVPLPARRRQARPHPQPDMWAATHEGTYEGKSEGKEEV